jgi:hypothetical protein
MLKVGQTHRSTRTVGTVGRDGAGTGVVPGGAAAAQGPGLDQNPSMAAPTPRGVTSRLETPALPPAARHQVTHMPPELLRLGKLSPAGDVYAFGEGRGPLPASPRRPAAPVAPPPLQPARSPAGSALPTHPPPPPHPPTPPLPPPTPTPQASSCGRCSQAAPPLSASTTARSLRWVLGGLGGRGVVLAGHRLAPGEAAAQSAA